MAWGTLLVGSLALKETDILEDVTNANTGERTVRFSGAETAPSSATQADLARKQADIMSLMNRTFPVQFSRKSEYNGFYVFTDTNTIFEKWAEGPAQTRWSLVGRFLGSDNAVLLEGRLATVVRANDHSLVGERWHAPNVGHFGYDVGDVVPATVTRDGDGFSIVVYRAIPAAVNPRWSTTVANSLVGRARILVDGVERVGDRFSMATTTWELNNGLVKVSWFTTSGGGLRVSAWSGGAWRARDWGVFSSSSVLISTWQQATVLRNDNEAVSLRLVGNVATGGQIILDLLLRRGSRFVECYMQRTVQADELKVRLNTAEASTLTSGYSVSDAAGADGIKTVSGSSKTVLLHANGGVVRQNTRTFDFWLGAEVAGAGSGDLAADMAQQYIGAMAEKVGVVKR